MGDASYYITIEDIASVMLPILLVLSFITAYIIHCIKEEREYREWQRELG